MGPLRSARLRLAATFAASALAAAAAHADEMRIEAQSGTQVVSIEGASASLEAVLHELAWRAGFEVRAFGVDDRSVVAHLHGVPVGEALRRLIGRDPYLIGVTRGKDGATRVAWVEVPGPRAAARPRKAAPATPTVPAAGVASVSPTTPWSTEPRPTVPGPFAIPPGIFLAAFDGATEPERAEALRAIEAQLGGDVAQRRAFLAVDPVALADAVAPYRFGADGLQALAERQRDADVRRKLEEAIGELYAAVERVPAVTGPSRSPLAEFFE
jgi:hypothetical protein